MQARIKFIDEVTGKFGPQFKIKAAPIDGGEDVTCYISQDSHLANGLAKGVVIELDTTAGKFPKITGIAPATEPTQQNQPIPSTIADFATICATWAAARTGRLGRANCRRSLWRLLSSYSGMLIRAPDALHASGR